MTPIPLGVWAISALGNFSSPYYVSKLVGTTFGNSAAIDSNGNIYVVGVATSGTAGYSIAKYESTGQLLIQKQIANGANPYDGYRVNDIVVDSSDNIFVYGGGTISKWDTNLNIIWDRNVGISTNSYTRALRMSLDSSNNVFVSGQVSAQSAVVKIDTNGNKLYDAVYRGGQYSDGASQTVSDNAGSLYLVGEYDQDGSAYGRTQVIKITESTQAISWQRGLGTTYYDSWTDAVMVGSDIIVCGDLSGEGHLAKYNSSGTLLWQRKFSYGSAPGTMMLSIAYDSANSFVYTLGQTTNAIYIAKYDLNGTLQWQRTLSGLYVRNGNSYYSGKVTLDANNDVVFVATQGSGIVHGKIPKDGSLTGTYTLAGNPLVYAASSLTETAGSASSANPSATKRTTTVAFATRAETPFTTTYTQEAIEIA